MLKRISLTTYNRLELIREKRGAVAVALIDPDIKNDSSLNSMLNLINNCDFDTIFVGGSLISDNEFERRIELIKSNTDLPIVIFPGSSRQLSKNVDAILFLSLISGRNPEYLIGEHVKSSPVIYKINLETIPTAYILLDGGKRSSVEIISNTAAIPMDKHDIITAHALAGQYLGNKYIFLESGSGAENHAATDVVSSLSNFVDIPIIIGGGIYTPASASELVNAGAGYIVTGTKIEQLPSSEQLHDFTKAIHGL